MHTSFYVGFYVGGVLIPVRILSFPMPLIDAGLIRYA